MILGNRVPDFGTVNVTCVVIGKKGSGKTVFLCKVAENNTRVIFVDPVGTAPCKGIVINDLSHLVQYISDNVTGKFRIVYRPQADEEVMTIFEIAYSIGNVVLVVDEADMYFKNRVTQDEANKVFRYGRHKNVAVFCATRRPVNLPRDITAVSEYAVVMRLTEPADVDFVAKWIQWEGRDIEKELRAIPQFSALFTDFAEPPAVMPLDTIAPIFYNLLSVSVDRTRPRPTQVEGARSISESDSTEQSVEHSEKGKT